jgi:hypothetical protein
LWSCSENKFYTKVCCFFFKSNNLNNTLTFKPLITEIFLRSARAQEKIDEPLSLLRSVIEVGCVSNLVCCYAMNRLNLKRHVTLYDIRRLRKRQNAKYFFFVLHVIYEMTSSNERVKAFISKIFKKNCCNL